MGNVSRVARDLDLAVGNRFPTGEVLHHSDRGSQYASLQYQKALEENGLVLSMSRPEARSASHVVVACGGVHNHVIADSYDEILSETGDRHGVLEGRRRRQISLG